MSPLQYCRSLICLILAPILTLIVSILALADLLLVRKSTFKAQTFPRFWGRAICTLAGVKVVVSGIENLDPQQTYIFAGNHCSQFDIFAFQGYFPHDFRWIAKKELFDIPIFGHAMDKVGYIPINRSHGREAMRSLDQAAKRIAGGSSVLIFPEGTRSSDGCLQEFKTGTVLLAIKAGVPVVPIGFGGTYNILPKDSLLPQSGQATIYIGRPIPTANFNSKDKQKLAQSLQIEVANLLAKEPTIK